MNNYDYLDLVKRIAMLEAEIARMKQEMEIENNKKETDTDWYDIDELCQKYKLPKNSVKSRQWRLENNFPTYQDGPYSRVSFKGKDVELWITDRLKNSTTY